MTRTLGRSLFLLMALLAVVLAMAQVSPAEPATAASTSLCSRAEYHQARWQMAHRKLLSVWATGNYERAALVAGSMSGIARAALADARRAPGGTSSARAFRARIIAVHRGQEAAAALYVEAMIEGGAGRTRAAGRAFAEASATQLRAGFVGDYC